MEDQRETSPDEPAPFLATEPPPLVARGLAIVLLSLFVVSAVLAAVVKVPETVSVPFVLVSLRGTDPIRAARGGRVASVNVAEGVDVKKGQVLFVLQSPGAADRSSELQSAEAREKSAREGMENARRKSENAELAAAREMTRLDERAAYYERMVQLKKEQLTLTTEQAERSEKLHAQGLASQNEQSDSRIRRAQQEMEYEQFRADAHDARGSVERLRLTEATRRAAARDEERALLEKLSEALSRIEAMRGGESAGRAGALPVEAPCDGTIVKMEVRSAGAFVQEGNNMAEISCGGDRLQAELAVPQEAVGQVRPGQKVKLLYQAFPYQRFGVKTGVVRWASPAAVPGKDPQKDSQVFRAFAELAEQTIRGTGGERPLLPGLRGTALVIVGRRSAISYAFAPLQQLRESFR